MGDWIRLRLHWRGGDDTQLRVRKNRSGEHRWTTDTDTGSLIRELARVLPDSGIALLLNRLGKRTGKGNRWTRSRVQSFRACRGVPVYRKGERRERGELTLGEAAERLSVSPNVVRRLIRDGILPARQACKGAPWVIAGEVLERPAVAAALQGMVTTDERQGRLGFD